MNQTDFLPLAKNPAQSMQSVSLSVNTAIFNIFANSLYANGIGQGAAVKNRLCRRTKYCRIYGTTGTCTFYMPRYKIYNSIT